MQDQGKRVLLAVALCAAILVVSTWLWGPKKTQTPPPAQPAVPTAPGAAPGQVPVPGAAPGQPGAVAVPGAAAPGAAAPVAPVAGAVTMCDLAAEKAAPIPPWTTDEYSATFSRCGGALASFQLLGKQYREEKKPIDLVRFPIAPDGTVLEDPRWYPLQVRVMMPSGTGNDPNAARESVVPPGAKWDLVEQTPDKIVFVWPPKEEPRTRGIEVWKTFTRAPASYLINATVDVKNVLQADPAKPETREINKRIADVSLLINGFQDPNTKTKGWFIFTYHAPYWDVSCYVNGKVKQHTVKELAEGPKSHSGDVRWFGTMHRYFLLAAAPTETDKEQRVCAAQLADPQIPGLMEARLTWTPEWTLAPQSTITRRLVVYAGPKILDKLEATSKVEGGKQTGLPAAVELGWFSFIARPMLWLLRTFHGWIGNWGVAIIMLTFVVKLITLYWTQKSMRSMKEMSRLKPKIDELREKYKDDKQRQNVEMMNLYKAHKINPLGGCLPMLLQMPVWFALYATLGAAAELFQARFLWMADLTKPDPFYIIPVALMILMFLQAKLSPAAVDSSQQKMMQYAMPLMFGGFSLFFPSGLGVYIMTNTTLQMAHQYYMNKTDRSGPIPVASSSSSEAKSGGSKSGGGKKKKSKD
jgi:YidC/Oxa1 family membrane protein insertase